MRINMTESVSGLILRKLDIYLGGLSKTPKIPIRMASIRADILTGHFPKLANKSW
jgi:hypothetical protein